MRRRARAAAQTAHARGRERAKRAATRHLLDIVLGAHSRGARVAAPRAQRQQSKAHPAARQGMAAARSIEAARLAY